MKELHITMGLQYGSCGKGLLSGYLAETLKPDTLISAWSPNSGHTNIDSRGRLFVNTAIPNGVVSPRLKRIMIGPGSIINPVAFWREYQDYQDLLEDVEICIHESAAVVTDRHREAEGTYGFTIGSTMKGCGEALIDKIRRPVNKAVIAREALLGTPMEGMLVSADEYNKRLDNAEVALLEGAQGFSLSINQGFYPFVTSRDCTTHQLLSDCAIPRHTAKNMQVYGVCRTYPIRVANRFDASGNKVGTSGPCYFDQEEISWDDLGIRPELTTVTRLPRRIFTWSSQQIKDAIRMNGVDKVLLNFVNYIDRDTRPGRMIVDDYFADIEATGVHPANVLIGNGPAFNDIEECPF